MIMHFVHIEDQICMIITTHTSLLGVATPDLGPVSVPGHNVFLCGHRYRLTRR
jgi:hypothetical protein